MKRINRSTSRLVPRWSSPKRGRRAGKTAEPIFLRQGDLDGACGFYCLLMALIALGIFRRREVLELETSRKHACLARIKTNARMYYFSGAGTRTLKKLLAPLNDTLDVSIINGQDNKVRDFALDHLAHGRFVVLGLENFREHLAHWALAVGVGGAKRCNRFKPARILLIDPDVERPRKTPWNSAIDLEPHAPYGRLRRVCETDGKKWLARFDGAVAIGLKNQAAQRHALFQQLT